MSIDNQKLFSKLNIIWKLWERRNDTLWPSQESSEWRQSETYEFLEKNSKYVGLDLTDVDNYFFYLNLLILNEDSLHDKTITAENMVLPKKNKLKYETVFTARGNIEEERVHTLIGYLTPDQLSNNFYDLFSEEVIDPYGGEVISTTYDNADYVEMDIKSAWVDDVLSESKLYNDLKKLPKQNLLEIQKTINKILS